MILVDFFSEDCCKASILLGDLEDWPETMEERIAFLEQCAEWEVIDNGGEW
jgi:hypothetical protein